ncbi:hypothetical protein Ciccas_010143 [Cichlidogyrus casuarinus]|uniref:Mitochondrial fission regulator 2 n=1 Tax=Cichlidogyrus casuarinus TaxID=1844966 RepID=A0ABD2PUY5_9PLAT
MSFTARSTAALQSKGVELQKDDRVDQIQDELVKLRELLAKLVMNQESHLFTNTTMTTSKPSQPPPCPPPPPPPPPVRTPATDWRHNLSKKKNQDTPNAKTPTSCSMADVLEELRSGSIKLRPVTKKPAPSPSRPKSMTPEDIIAYALKARFSALHKSPDSSPEKLSDSWLEDSPIRNKNRKSRETPVFKL